MSLRKHPVNIGVVFEDNVLYASDLDIRPVLDLARFSISFAKNLVRDAYLVEIVHEPSMMLQQGEVSRAHAEGKLSLITREHVLFKFLTNDAGETVAICATYPSNDDLKVLDIADLTPEQLTAQAKAFIDAFSRRFIDVTGFKTINLAANNQEHMLQLYSAMATLYEETLQASQVIFKDDYASVGQDSLADQKKCTFLFAAAMNGSVPCASRFFENMEGFFKIRMDSSADASSIIENLISAQLSTIVTTSLSVARTMIRSVELKIKGAVRDDTLHITFFPIKNNFTLVFISKGSPTTLRFFTEATASMLANVDVLSYRFTGDLSQFGQVSQVLKNIPPTIDSEEKQFDIDDMSEDMTFEAMVDDSRGSKARKKEDENDSLQDESDMPFTKIKAKLLKVQVELNTAMASNKIKVAEKKAKEIWNMAIKSKSLLLAYYYENKVALLSLQSKN
jgi:hypothetical protein